MTSPRHSSSSRALLLGRLALLALSGAAASLAGFAGTPSGAPPPVAVLTLEGIIDPVLANYVKRGYREAERMGAQCVLLSINTPGGLEGSMREIVQETLNAELPTVAFVNPQGGRAASAGAFIVLACHIAAMAPGTTMGAAHPVAAKGADIPATLDKKITNDAAAFIRSLAKQRGRDEKWAEEAVTKSLSINAEEALERGLVDVVAPDLAALLEAVDGKRVTVGSAVHTLETKGALVKDIALSFQERFFHMLAHPEIAYILLSLGTLGLIFELQSSGLGVAGFVGGICLILAFISLSIIPFNVGGLLMMALGVGLFFADIKLSTHGGLSLLGVGCLLLGSLMLFAPLEPFWHLSRMVVFSVVGITAAFFGVLVWLGLRAQSRPPALTTATALVGVTGRAVTPVSPNGIVHVQGEDWSARLAAGARRIARGQDIIVRSSAGMTLEVEPLTPEETALRTPQRRTRT